MDKIDHIADELRRVKREMLLERIRQTEVIERIDFDEGDERAYFDRNKVRYVRLERTSILRFCDDRDRRIAATEMEKAATSTNWRAATPRESTRIRRRRNAVAQPGQYGRAGKLKVQVEKPWVPKPTTDTPCSKCLRNCPKKK